MPGIAMRQNPHIRTVYQSGSESGDGEAHGHIFRLYRLRLTAQGLQQLRKSKPGGQGVEAPLHPPQGRGKIHGCGTGRAEIPADAVKFIPGIRDIESRLRSRPPGRHIQPVGGRDTDGRSSPDPQFGDSLIDLVLIPEGKKPLLSRQQSLVDYHHSVTRCVERHTVVCEQTVELHGVTSSLSMP